MKTHTKVFLGVLGVATIAGVAVAGHSYADGRGWKGQGFGGHHRGMGPAMILERFDVDGDGKVTRDEAATTIDEKLATFDGDTNGTLSLEEFQGLWVEQTHEMMVRGFQRLDRDGDGEITRAEIDGPIEHVFGWMDRNEDGAIEMRELRRDHHRGGRDDDDDREEG